MKSPVITVQVEDKGTNTDPVNITTQKEDKLVEGKTYSNVAVQMMEIPSDDLISNSTIVPEVNQEIPTHMIREIQTRKTSYRHPNHKRIFLNHSMNL